jgi:hypothetical protein
MQPTPDQAARLLANANALSGQVRQSAARESRVFLGWGAFALVMLPPFDFVLHAIWGPIIAIFAFAGWRATVRYYRRRSRRVHLPGRRRWALAWGPWGVWYGALIFMAELLQAQAGFIWTAAAVGASLPLFVIGAHLSRQGR